jgi:hypothetical protein
MKNFIKLSVFAVLALFIIYGCNEEGPTITNQNGSGNNAPVLPHDPVPADNATNVPRLLTVSWQCEDPDAGDTVKYDIKIGNNNPPDVNLVSNLTAASYSIPYLLAGDTNFFWRVIAKDNRGAVTSGNVWKFRTGTRD